MSLGNTSDDSSDGVAVSADRDGVADGVFEVRTLEETT